jgi:hypothetical protein
MTIEHPEIIEVDKDTDQVCCDGGNGVLGHPVVECLYCDRCFVKEKDKLKKANQSR